MSKALRFIAERNVQLVSIGPEDIVDGNVKLTLGMVWTIILRFAISELSEEGLSAKQGLLLWCQKKTQGYRDVNVRDFQDSFKDGLAFCALIHRHRPDLLDFDPLSRDDARANLTLAFDVAEKHLGIPKLLDVEDMVSLPRPDERSVMTYCAALYKVFSQYDKVEMAGKRLGKFINFMRQTQGMIHDYEERARKLRAEIDERQQYYSTVQLADDYNGVRGQIAAFKDYRRTAKAQMVADQSDLAGLLSNIQIKLKSMNRPSYEPPSGLGTAEIEQAVEELTATERAHRSGLNSQMRAILDGLRKAFAEPANAFFAQLNEFKTALTAVAEGDIETQTQALVAKRNELADLAPQLDVILAAEQACDAANIEENEYSDLYYEDLKALFDHILRSFEKKVAFLQAQAEEAKGGASADKMIEFKESFDHFDVDHNGALDRLEFFACLASLGLANVDFTGQDPETERLWNKVSEGTGKITFDQYVRYMSTLVEDTYDPAQINEAFHAVAGGKEYVTATDLQRAQLTPEQTEYVTSTFPRSSMAEDGYDFSSFCH